MANMHVETTPLVASGLFFAAASYIMLHLRRVLRRWK